MVASLALACGGKEPPASPATPAASTEAPPATAAAPEAPAAPAPEPKKRKPFDVHNGCADAVTVVFAEDPTAKGADKRTMAPTATIEGPRNADGNQTVWLLDANGESLVKVNVTRGMKRVEIGRSCRTLDAR